MRVREIREGSKNYFVACYAPICACCGSVNTQDINMFNRYNSGYTIFAGATHEDIIEIIPSDEYDIHIVPLEDDSFLLIKCNTEEYEDD